ncbi:MAG: hypothetical protein FJX54_23590 [Alphaproteobacteria bacterium]|nr:hypothetical protein [Alphaproteobacteria bacterium]
MIYTGVGCNCFSPMVSALDELKTAIRAGLEETETMAAINDIDQVLTFLLGQNFGMGTRITNQRIGAGAALLFTLSIVGWLYSKSRGV